ncbi:MAG: NAD(P)H-dependent oxidoreductase, partial [Lentisphaeria bacterium]|nr:NAD(P)H-dependent oxidoreductase [Lentisphaeria bacterium]
MNVLIVYCHPEPHSFNHAMFQTACQALRKGRHKIRISDLHRMKFDPVSGRSAYKTVKNPERFRQQLEEMYASERFGFADFIENEIEKIEDCDLMIWQFPLWWCSIPALLKGWVDRVFAMGRIYGGGHMYETGFCAGKKALLSLTTGGGMELYQPGGANG